MKAAIIGASGLVGQQLLKLLLASDRYDAVHFIGRRRLDLDSIKLYQHIIPLEQINTIKLDTSIDDVFCTLGTTIDKAGTRENFSKVDRDYVCSFAAWAIVNGASAMAVNSSLGADEKSINFYLKTKGEMEQCVKRAGFESLTIVRPSLLVPTGRRESRFGEELSYLLSRLFGWILIGKLRRYRPVKPEAVARAMLVGVMERRRGVRVVESEQIG